MSLADDCLPEECLEICAKTIENNLVEITKNVPTGNECSNEVLAKKYTILGSCFREIKTYVGERSSPCRSGVTALPSTSWRLGSTRPCRNSMRLR